MAVFKNRGKWDALYIEADLKIKENALNSIQEPKNKIIH